MTVDDAGVTFGAKLGEAPESDSAGTATTVSARLRAVESMDRRALEAEWRRLYRATPPKRLSRDVLFLGVAWKLQEQSSGGLTATTRRRLGELATALARDGDLPRNRIAHLRPGTKLVRGWRGTNHTVTVLEEGFEWQGGHWRSLSAIARAITGAHWSGPRFFGLAGNADSRSQKSADEAANG